MDKKLADKAFKVLALAIRAQTFRGDRGPRYHLKADEFMFMGEGKEGKTPVFLFKHKKSRNYLIVAQDGSKVIVPTSGKPFEKGIFPESTSVAELGCLLQEMREQTGVDEGYGPLKDPGYSGTQYTSRELTTEAKKAVKGKGRYVGWMLNIPRGGGGPSLQVFYIRKPGELPVAISVAI